MWRARRGFLTFRRATTADSKEAARQKLASRDAGPARGGRQEAACARLRINGDAVEVGIGDTLHTLGGFWTCHSSRSSRSLG